MASSYMSFVICPLQPCLAALLLAFWFFVSVLSISYSLLFFLGGVDSACLLSKIFSSAPKIIYISDLEDICIREVIEIPPGSVAHGASSVAAALVGSQLLKYKVA